MLTLQIINLLQNAIVRKICLQALYNWQLLGFLHLPLQQMVFSCVRGVRDISDLPFWLHQTWQQKAAKLWFSIMPCPIGSFNLKNHNNVQHVCKNRTIPGLPWVLWMLLPVVPNTAKGGCSPWAEHGDILQLDVSGWCLSPHENS